jgi:fructan beta-fructosidase
MLLSINPGAPNGGSGTQYFLGDFDGKAFSMYPAFAEKVAADTASGNPFWIDYGRDNYAGVTWSDVPKKDGRRIFIGWMSNWNYANVVPTDRWRSAMTLPRTLSLRNTPKGQLLCAQPVEEAKAIVQDKTTIPGQTISGQLNLTGILDSPSPTLRLDLQLSWTAGEQPEQISLVFSNAKGESYRITLKGDTFYADRSNAGETSFEEGFGRTATAPRWSDENKLDVEVWLDVASVELFADSGATNLTEIFFPGEPFTQVTLEVEGGTLELESGEIGRAVSIWQ